MLGSDRISDYKYHGKNCEELRRRRAKVLSEHRDQFKFQKLVKRRNINWSQLESPPGVAPVPLQGPTQGCQSLLHPSFLQQLESLPETFNDQVLKYITDDLFSDNDMKHLRGATWVRKVLGREDHPPFKIFIDSAVVQQCIQFIQKPLIPQLQYEAGWILTNIASGTSDQTQFVVKCGAVKPLIAMLHSCALPVVYIATLALANIAGDGCALRDFVINEGAVVPLVVLAKLALSMTEEDILIVRAAAFALSNMCRGRYPPPGPEACRQCLVGLVGLVKHQDVEVVAHACRAISYISDCSNERIPEIGKCEIVPRLVQLLDSTCNDVVASCLRIIFNMVATDDLHTKQVLKAGALPKLANLLLTTTDAEIRKIAVWSIANIAGGTKKQVCLVIKSNIVPALVALLQIDPNGVGIDTQYGVLWTLRNMACEDSLKHLLYLDEQGIIPNLCTFINPFLRSDIISLILEILDYMLVAAYKINEVHRMTFNIKNCGGLGKIETLQYHTDKTVKKKACEIIRNYFSCCDSGSTSSGSHA